MTNRFGDSDTAHEVTRCARAVEIAIRELCRATTSRPRMRPSDVSALLADLAAATAVFPQVATQLGDILNRAKHDYRLEMDTMAPGEDPARGCRDCEAPSWRDPRSGTRPLTAPRRSAQRDRPHRLNRPAGATPSR